MARASLIRTVRFRAAHHYRRREWTEEENRRVFGSSVEPHEHEYALEVTVTGDVDPSTGFLVDLPSLDDVLEQAVGPLRGRDLVEAIPEAREGRMLTSTENLAGWFFGRLRDRIPGSARLERVRVAESAGLAAEFSDPATPSAPAGPPGDVA